MRNITLSVPEEVYKAARIRAAERGTSVSALVAEYLRVLSREGSEFARLERQQHLITKGIREFRAGDRLSGDDVHDGSVR